MADQHVEPQHVNVTRREGPPPLQAEPGKSRAAYIGALAAAAMSDALSVAFEFFEPLQLAVDILTALVIWALLGWRWYMLGALIAEAIPGVALFPTWFMVVMAYGVFPKPKQQR